MESLWQATVTASSYQPDNPPFSLRHQPTVELLTWEAQTRPKLVQSTVVSVDNPPFSQRVVAAYELPTWDAQTRPKLVQGARVDDPPFDARRRSAWISVTAPRQTWAAQWRVPVPTDGGLPLRHEICATLHVSLSESRVLKVTTERGVVLRVLQRIDRTGQV